MSFASRGCMHARRGYPDVSVHASLCYFLLHKEFRHSAAHDVAKANKRKRSCRWRNQSLVIPTHSDHVKQTQASISPSGARPETQNDTPLFQQEIWNEPAQHILRSTSKGSSRRLDHKETPLEDVIWNSFVCKVNSYPKLCIKSPQADSMEVTDSAASCD